MMQHENGADAGQHRLQEMMRAGQRQGAETGPDDRVAKLFHGAPAAKIRRFKRGRLTTGSEQSLIPIGVIRDGFAV